MGAGRIVAENLDFPSLEAKTSRLEADHYLDGIAGLDLQWIGDNARWLEIGGRRSDVGYLERGGATAVNCQHLVLERAQANVAEESAVGDRRCDFRDRNPEFEEERINRNSDRRHPIGGEQGLRRPIDVALVTDPRREKRLRRRVAGGEDAVEIGEM